ncbi:MAG TPA: ATPase domain-containing protein [Bryobacteraceae bacterium]|jgi:circadian clock protein KaiC|nr:ATPase domain-containing protein [Bryobacteraceae bacterium]
MQKRHSETGKAPAVRQTTGIPGLDEVLGGGLPANRLYVVEGDPGSGKTTLALQFLLEGVRLGQQGLYVTLSETLEELDDVANSHGWSLDGINLLELNSVSGRLEQEANYTVYHPADVELGETTSRIRAEVEKLNPERVALDSVSELKILSQTSARYRREILALKQFFSGRNCTVLILDDLTTLQGEQQLQSIAHGVIRMEREGREYGSTRRQIHIVKLRGVRFQDGRHDFVIKTGGVDLYPRLMASGQSVSVQDGAAESGSAELDSLLGGGLDRGSSVLLLGPAGCGKTTLCSQYLRAALERGERVVCYLFEERRETFLFRSDGFGMDFAPYIASGQFELVQVDIGELSPGEFANHVRLMVEKRAARFVVIDSLNGYLNGMPSERFLLIHMHELLSYLGQKGVVTLLTIAQHGMMGSAMETPIDISFLADTVILLRFFESAGVVRQAISVVKKRRGAHERTLREMRIGSTGARVGEVLREFQGVLTGVPRFSGDDARLLDRDDKK